MSNNPPEQLPAETYTYRQQLALALSPLPFFASTSAYQLPAVVVVSDTTHCRFCQAKLVGGVNGSYRVGRGRVWTSCDGCGKSLSRKIKLEEEHAAVGKSAFERVKKRRRAQQREKGINQAMLPSRTVQEAPQTTAPSSPAPPMSPSATTNIPRSSAIANSFPRISHEHPHIISTIPSHPPPPSSTSTPPPPTDAIRKKKRTKQGSSLAAMLEAKKQEQENEKKKSSSGLQDFLQLI